MNQIKWQKFGILTRRVCPDIGTQSHRKNIGKQVRGMRAREMRVHETRVHEMQVREMPQPRPTAQQTSTSSAHTHTQSTTQSTAQSTTQSTTSANALGSSSSTPANSRPQADCTRPKCTMKMILEPSVEVAPTATTKAALVFD